MYKANMSIVLQNILMSKLVNKIYDNTRPGAVGGCVRLEWPLLLLLVQKDIAPP